MLLTDTIFYTTLARGIFLSFLFFAQSSGSTQSCLQQKYRSRIVPSLFEQALNQLLSKENIVTIIQKLRDCQMLAGQGNPDAGKRMWGSNLCFLRASLFERYAQKLRVQQQWFVNKITDCRKADYQGPVTTLQSIQIEELLVVGGLDGVLRLTDEKMNKSIARFETNRGAFSSLTANAKILATANQDVPKIQLWAIKDPRFLGEINIPKPTVFMHIVDKLLIVLDTDGYLDFYDVVSGHMVYILETGMQGKILSAAWNDMSRSMFITTSEAIYMANLGNLIALDRLMHPLRIDQIIVLAYILHQGNSIWTKDQDLVALFDSLPKEIQELFTNPTTQPVQ